MTDKKLAQVRALLAKAESTTHPAEAELLREKAMELIVKYGIDEAMLAAHHGFDSARISKREIVTEAPFAQEKVQLYTSLSHPMGIRAVQYRRWASGEPFRRDRSDRQVVVLQVYGRAGDLDAAEILYTSLLLQQAAEFARVDPVGWRSNGADKAAYRRSWLIAYAATIYQRILAEYQKQTDAITGAALVLVDKVSAVEDALHEDNPRIRARKKRSISGMGWADGHAAGARADLGPSADSVTNRDARELG